jgi:3-oxoacyl-[acyl-carrier-protein] synthase III
MSLYAHITGWGFTVPEKILTNDDLSKIVDTNDEWIRDRTGIHQRHIASNEETTASLGASAGLKALEYANVSPEDVDMVVVASSSPEYIFPATSSLIQDKIGAKNAGAFDIQAACTGFIFALNVGTQFIRGKQADTVLVIGSEKLSSFVDWTDRNTCILFGDGAGAFVLQGSNKPGGIISSVMRSDGSGGDLLDIKGGGSTSPATSQTISDGLHYITMNGREVFRFATRVMAQASNEALDKAGWSVDDLSLIVPHQANKRIIDAAARGLKLPEEKFAINLHKYGNTSTASIPIAAVEAVEEGRIKNGDKIVLVGFGGGLSWGALTVLWTGPFESDKQVNFKLVILLSRFRSLLKRNFRKIEGWIWGKKNTND